MGYQDSNGIVGVPRSEAREIISSAGEDPDAMLDGLGYSDSQSDVQMRAPYNDDVETVVCTPDRNAGSVLERDDSDDNDIAGELE